MRVDAPNRWSLIMTMLLFISCGLDSGSGPSDVDTGTDTGTSGTDTETEQETDTGAALVISDLAITPNPNSEISFYVSWNTNLPASSRVDLGETVDYTHRVSEDDLVTSHNLLVIGCHAKTEYHLKAFSSAGGQDAESEEVTYKTGPLPYWISDLTIGAHAPDLTQPGWTLINYFVDQAPPTLAMYDLDGRPVWYYVALEFEGARAAVHASLVDDEDGGFRVLASAMAPSMTPVEVDLAGNIQWNGPPQPDSAEWRMHHHFGKLSNGDYVTLRTHIQDGYHGDIIDQISPELDSTWSWNVFDCLTPSPEAELLDWTHGNSVTVDLEDDVVYYSTRALSMVYKIDRSTGVILWGLGQDGDFLPDPEAAWPWQIGQHDPEIQADGNVLLYDNGDLARGFTRVVEYTLDTTEMTARIVWEFPGAFLTDNWYSDSWFTQSFGDADRLPNGNTLVTAGSKPLSGNWPNRIFEVTPDGVLAWEMLLDCGTLTDHDGCSVYRSERIPALLEKI